MYAFKLSSSERFLFSILLCLPYMEDARELKNILIFGGNGLLGAPTTERLIRTGEFSILLVNRGNWYWDTSKTIRPHVKHISCDRYQSLEKCQELSDYIHWSGDQIYFEAVIDFSAYHPFQISEAISVLNHRTGIYIYISTDSVYEVCNKTHEDLTRESDDIRPETRDEYNAFASTDDYGHRKLLCEEELVKQRNQGGVPYVFLRLPDVIGPRDNTERLWIYQLWIRLAKYLQRPVSVPKFIYTEPLSLVYSEDVAEIIVKCVSPAANIKDQAFNLAFEETPNLLELLTAMKEELKENDLAIEIVDSSDPLYLFPSVKKGPVDITKAKTYLDWKPTEWREALRKVVSFYESAIRNSDFDQARSNIVRTMQRHFTKAPFRVVQGLKNVYNTSYPANKDEL